MAGYSQNDPRWAGDALGTSTYWLVGNAQGNARSAGCYVTAGADVLQAFGRDITPGELNKLATSRGLINGNGDVVRPDWLSVLFPDVLEFVEFKDWGNDPADLKFFDIRNDLNTEVIVMIDDSPSGGLQTHFMRVVGWDGGDDVIVDDSWDAVRKGVNAYGARWNPAVHAKSIIYNASKFRKVQPPAPQPTVPLEQPAPVVITVPVTQTTASTTPVVTTTTSTGDNVVTTSTATPTPTSNPEPFVVPSKTLWDLVLSIIGRVKDFLTGYKKG